MNKDQSKRMMERKLFKDMIMQGIDKNMFKKHKPTYEVPVPRESSKPIFPPKIDSSMR